MIQQQDMFILKTKIIAHPTVQTYRSQRWEEDRSLPPRRPAWSSVSQLPFRPKEVGLNASDIERGVGLITAVMGIDFERKDTRNHSYPEGAK